MIENPEIDIAKAAEEVKAFLDMKKIDLVDYTYWNIEAYPNPESDDYPELKKFAKMWKDMFDEADKLVDDEGNGFPEETVQRYEAELGKIVEAVNSDQAYWDKIRAEVLPLYEPPKLPEALEKKREEERLKKIATESEHDKLKREMKEKMMAAWQGRWQKVEMFYDPVDFDVVTTQMYTNKTTGERTRGDVLRKTVYPQGFVVKVI